jgi:mercuric ion transport protein
MNDRALITGAAGAVVAAICCATPFLAVIPPLVGLSAWLAGAALVLLPLLAASLALMAWDLHRRRVKAACRGTAIEKEGVKP